MEWGNGGVSDHSSDVSNVGVLFEVITMSILFVNVIYLGLNDAGEECVVVSSIESNVVLDGVNIGNIDITNINVKKEVLDREVSNHLEVHFKTSGEG